MLREKFTSFCFVSCFHSDSLQTAPDSVGLYAQQVSRCGRDGEVALGLLFFNCSDMGPVRRAADREAVSTADVRAGTSVVVDHLESRTAALVDSAAFTGRGIPLHRVDAVLATLAAASLFEVGHRSPSRGSVRRGPSWGSPSLSLSADATHVLFTLLVPMFLSGGVFAYCVVSDVATRSHFVSRGLRAANAVVLALEELSDCGVLRSFQLRHSARQRQHWLSFARPGRSHKRGSDKLSHASTRWNHSWTCVPVFHVACVHCSARMVRGMLHCWVVAAMSALLSSPSITNVVVVPQHNRLATAGPCWLQLLPPPPLQGDRRPPCRATAAAFSPHGDGHACPSQSTAASHAFL